MSIELDNLQAAVERVKGAKASAIALIKGAAAYITAHATDPVALRAFAAELNTDADDLGEAVTANPLPTDPVPPTP